MKLKEEQLSSAETVRGDPEGVEEQLRQLQVLYMSLVSSGRGGGGGDMAESASSDD